MRSRGRKANKEHYHKYPEKFILKRLADNEKSEMRMLARIKSKSKKLGIKFDLQPEDVEIPTHCPILGIVLHHKPGRGVGYKPDCASLDRIVPDKGYVKGNIRVISSRANLLKNDAEVWELEAVLKDLKKLRSSP